MMPHLGRWLGPALRRSPLLICAVAIAAALLGTGPAAAREVVVTGSKMNRFGRILLQFDQPTKVTARVANAVLIITFAEAAKVKSEKLATELAPYVTTVRRDPDGTGLRLALATPVRPNILEAAERVFVDLLPPNWSGFPPSLPPEVVAELAARVQQAEAKLKAASPRPAAPPKSVRLRMGETPTLTRLVFEAPADLPVRVEEGGDAVQLSFDGQVAFEDGGAKPKLAAGVAGFEATAGAQGLIVRVKPAPGYAPRTFQEPDGLILDLAKPQPAQVLPEAQQSEPRPAPMTRDAVLRAHTDAQAGQPEPPAAAPQTAAQPKPAPPVPGKDASERKSVAEGERAAADARQQAPSTVIARIETTPDATALVFPFRRRTPAAAYLRAGALTIVFDSQDRLDVGALAGAANPALRPLEFRAEDGLTVLRLPEPEAGAVRFLADGEGWRLSTGNGAGLPGDALKVSRGLDEHGRPLVRVGLDDPSRAHWLTDPDGARLAVVTAAGRTQAVPLPRTFVEFGLVPSLHGVVVEARADDLTIGLSQAGVAIAREVGLSLSPPGRDGNEGRQGARIALPRDLWVSDVGPDSFNRYMGLVWDSSHAAKAGRAEARARLARFLLANGMNQEAGSVLALARREDPLFARRREALILSGIAAVRANHGPEGRGFLTTDGISEDPEAVLWRAVADAKDRRWEAALAGFRRTGEIVELYPDELAGPVRLLALNAALETGDIGRAEGELGAIDRLAVGAVPRDEHDLARARVDDVAGRSEAAFRAYEKLMAEAELPVATAATLRWARLGLASKAIDLDAAIARLETLSVIWRGGEMEVATITDLARLYGQAKRWRDMFAMARRANGLFPKHPATRALQEDSGQILEQLLLGAEGGKLSGVQALALYFDFKEMAPVGRRGDEIVRRLADRLVELDLLDQAADLLQYQIDKRLTGAARATVAARLAAIRLMSGKPLLALGALHATRLSELPEEVRRFRFMLEARAQADLSRTDLALEILEGETGPDFDRLRTSILWSARRWREAGEAGEALLGTRWDGPEPLTDRERSDVLRAAIAYALGDERISLERLKQKFGRKIMDSPDAKTFEVVVSPGGMRTREFRLAAQEATKADSLRHLLADWRGQPVDQAGEGEAEKAPPAAPAATTPRAQSAAGAPARG